MPNYVQIQDTALRLIQDAGQVLQFSRKISNNHDPITGSSEDTFLQGDFTVAIFPISKDSDIALEEGLRSEQVRSLLVAAKEAPFELQGLDICVFENKQWVVIGCTPLNPAGIPLVYRTVVKLI